MQLIANLLSSLDEGATLDDIGREIVSGSWWQWPAEFGIPGPITLAIGIILLLFVALAFVAGWQQKRRRTLLMLAAVNDATFGRCLPRSRSGAWGFAVGIEPPPERFREFNISYQPVSIFDPFDLLRRLLSGRRSTLQISAVLADAPVAEIVWQRGHPPARALGVNPGHAPWVQSKLEYTGAEYATRGTNVGAIKHVFRDMVARFSPALTSVAVQRERRPQLRMVVRGRIDPRDVSPLVTAARALGRAAMME